MTLQATAKASNLTAFVGQNSATPLEDYSYCYYWIEVSSKVFYNCSQAPTGQQVQVTLKSYSGYYADGCPYGGVEIKTHKDQKLTGYRYEKK